MLVYVHVCKPKMLKCKFLFFLFFVPVNKPIFWDIWERRKKIMLFLNKNTEVSVDFIGCTLDAVDD